MEALDAVAYNRHIEELRIDEYPMIQDSVYLDHTGTTLPSKSLIEAFSQTMTSNLFGNPHSGSHPSQLSTSRIQDIRLRLITFLGADPLEFDLIFTANTTAAIKLVCEAFQSQDGGFEYVYHEACHTSLVGVREEARESICLRDEDVEGWMSSGLNDNQPLQLFAYTAQSHVTGRRYSSSWDFKARANAVNSQSGVKRYTLLDLASLAATSPVNLCDESQAPPDFAVLSLYKIFGFPDLGALLARREAWSIFDHKRYFGGGTVDTVVCHDEKWHVPKSQFLHERLEDGTLPFHNIIALDAAMDAYMKLFGNINLVSKHVSGLRDRLLMELSCLQHYNGQPVCVLYSQPGSSGPLAFNLKDADGVWVSNSEFEKLANMKKIYVRTGGLCGPGSIASLLDLHPWEIRKNFSAGFRCGGSSNDIISGKPTGVIRVSLGAMSTVSDIVRFLAFIREFYCQKTMPPLATSPGEYPNIEVPGFTVKELTIFPIKSCAEYKIPDDSSWELKPEGLAWDREWCLVHRGTGQALSQKRYTRMALLQPTLDFTNGVLRVTYIGPDIRHRQRSVCVPLSMDPLYFSVPQATPDSRTCRVCGDNITAKVYACESVNDFFTTILEVPCALARFPPGGVGAASRTSKLRNGKSFEPRTTDSLLPSPPDSDSEKARPGKLLLANESPILMIHEASVKSISTLVQEDGGREIPAASFRGNIVVGGGDGAAGEAYGEEHWAGLRIGRQQFRMLGPCQRCQMVCVNQKTGEKDTEPFVTLTKTRRIGGKVYFGMHMMHTGSLKGSDGTERQNPVIRVGDEVSVCYINLEA